MPGQHDGVTEAPGSEEADKLVDLVEVVLGLNVVFPPFAGELELRGEGDRRAMEGDEPDGEELGEVYVEY